MHLKHTLLFLLVLTSLWMTVKAQRVREKAGLQYSHFSKASIIDTLGSTTFQEMSIAFSELRVFIDLPVHLGENTQLDHRLDYSTTGITYSDFPGASDFSEAKPTRFHSLNYGLTWIQGLGNNWSFQVTARPGIASDLQDGIASDDFIFQGKGLLQKSFQEDGSLTLGLGATYTTVLGEPLLLPLLDFYWKTKRIELDGQFPFYGKAYYWASPKVHIGLMGTVEGNRYHLTVDDTAPVSVQDIDNAGYFMVSGGPALRWNTGGGFWITGNAGITLTRTLEIYDTSDKNKFDFDTENHAFFAKLIVTYGK